MRNGSSITVIIPTLNEERAIGQVLDAIPHWVDDIIVVDNGSTDRTVKVAEEHGARVVREPQRGYGVACLTGIASSDHPDILVFLDGDFSDHPNEMDLLVDPIADSGLDLVIGSRVLGRREAGALTLQARFGNWLACLLIKLFWSKTFTDLGPFRAVRYSSLQKLCMQDQDFGWTVEMQIKAAQLNLAVKEVPVSYRQRIGESKISGTVKGVVFAGTKILYTIFHSALLSRRGGMTGSGLFGQNERNRLMVFTRCPEPGKTKTRLIPALGAEGAAELQNRMTVHTLWQAREARRSRELQLEVRFEGGTKSRMKQLFGSDLEYLPQGEGNLGDRMVHAFQAAFGDGVEGAIIIGTDCPGAGPEQFKNTFDLLRTHDLVLGPADDGGYYLIGLRRLVPELFRDIPWGTGDVLAATMERAHEAGLSVATLETMRDVDRPEDIEFWNEYRSSLACKSGVSKLSVVIPVLNEAVNISRVLGQLENEENLEIIVVDGGSTDQTRTLVERFGVRVICCHPNRADQMNIGAAAASGETLLFLHADTILPTGFQEHVRRVLSQIGVIAGAFELRIGTAGSRFRWCERLINWRSRYMQLPYGDQALFMTAGVFKKIGGFPPIQIMEDYVLVKRLRRRGRIELVPLPVETSARRWKKLGLLRTTLINQLIIAGYHLGVSHSRLLKWQGKSSSCP